VTSAVRKPVNIVMSAADPAITAAQLADAGVKRISVGGALSRLAFAAVLKAAQEMQQQGGFTWVSSAMPTQEVKRIFSA
jgi:2-methylisocitrate lyase-like PEP mutase family enzyme